MKDRIGQEIESGDQVLYTCRARGSDLYKSHVVALNKIALEKSLRGALEALNDVPHEFRSKEVIKARTIIQRRYDEEFNGLKPKAYTSEDLRRVIESKIENLERYAKTLELSLEFDSGACHDAGYHQDLRDAEEGIEFFKEILTHV